MKPGPKPKAPAERFWLKVDRSGGPDACWPWTGSTDGRGYGSFNAGPERGTVRAYVFAWELENGRRQTPGLDICHGCENPPCCNPRHLYEGTHRHNLLMSESTVSGIAARQTHCPRNHPYDGANLIVKKDGARACRACRREEQRRYYANLSPEARQRRRTLNAAAKRRRYAADKAARG